MPQNMRKEIMQMVNNNDPVSKIEDVIKEGNYSKMKFADMEWLINELFQLGKPQVIKLISSYFTKLVNTTQDRFLHLKVDVDNPKSNSQDMIESYKYIFMYNRYVDCSMLLYNWSPTESYFPVLLYIHKSNPDKPIDYIYWLKRFDKLPIALKFLKQNSIPIDFEDPEDLKELYKTIPQEYIKDFLDLLGTKSWYMDVIKETDHFLEEVEEWE